MKNIKFDTVLKKCRENDAAEMYVANTVRSGDFAPVSGKAVADALATKQPLIDADHKLPAEFIEGSVTAQVEWGAINGNIADQADLASALDGKLDASALGDDVAPLVHGKVPEQNLPDDIINAIDSITVNGDPVTVTDKTAAIVLPEPIPQVQANWNESDSSSPSYIQNKPSLDYIPTGEKGAASGVATLDVTGKVPTSQLPDDLGSGIESIVFNGDAVPVSDRTATITAYIPDALSDLAQDSTHMTVTSAEKAAWDAKLDVSDLVGYATESYVDTAVSSKADASALTAHTSNNTIHVTAAEKTAWDDKSDFSGSYNDLTNKPSLDFLPLAGGTLTGSLTISSGSFIALNGGFTQQPEEIPSTATTWVTLASFKAYMHIPNRTPQYTLPAIVDGSTPIRTREIAVETWYRAYTRLPTSDTETAFAWRGESRGTTPGPIVYTDTATVVPTETLVYPDATLEQGTEIGTVRLYEESTGLMSMAGSVLFRSNNAHITPLREVTIRPGSVVLWLCRYINASMTWSVLPILLK